MLSYPGYPTPPSTSEDSPPSYITLSPASYVSDSSSSTGLSTSHVVLVTQNSTGLPFQGLLGAIDATGQSEQPYLDITEQPVDRFRFRYKSEMTGTHGCLNGERSDKTRKMTYPTVKLHNHVGTAIIRCSIWQINHGGNDFRPHAHRLVKKKHGKEEADDPHEITINEESKYLASFYSMGIIHTAKKNIVSELIKKKSMLMKEAAGRNNRTLSKKEELEIKGLAEAESKSINLNVVCLRFDAYYATDKDLRVPICPPVFSQSINNLKSALTGELKIVRMDHCTSPASGGREIFLLVERVTKKNIRVRFYELDDKNLLVWEDYGKFTDLDVHHQYAIVLRTPRYKDGVIGKQVNVFMELVRPSDNATSVPMEFTYIPVTNSEKPGSKRPRPNEFDTDYDTSSSIGSQPIPRTINNISEELKGININTDHLDSAEIDKLLNEGNEAFSMESIDTKDFTDFFNRSRSEYEAVCNPNLLSCNMSLDVAAHGNYIRCGSNSRIGSRYHYKKKILRVIHEITEFLKTKPSIEGTIKHLRHYLLNFPDNHNAFHMAVVIGDVRAIELFIKLIIEYRQFDLVNVPSKTTQETVLHLAVTFGYLELTQTLVTKCTADISRTDLDLNTPLHIAAENKNGQILECLLKAENSKTHIDLKNKNGNTSLHRAVKRGNLRAVQLLYQYGADINCHHHTNGFTPLRFAIENRDMEMIKFIIRETNTNFQEDFQGVHPFQVVNQTDYPKDIADLVQKYSIENNISWDGIEIKEEPEDEESEEEKDIFEEQVKAEALPFGEDYQNIFQNITHFTDECLNDISTELDASGKWQDLAHLLDIEHLIRMDTIDEKSPGKKILELAVQFATIEEIRGFLENLDETKAVKAIDRMALNLYNKSSKKSETDFS